ncbi:MAG: dTMP kinase [Rectinema sp.]
MSIYNTDELKKRFIVIEGIDGAGTTTQLQLLAESLDAKKIPCVTTAEPTRSPVGKIIRAILSNEIQTAPTTVAYLYATDRNEHLYGTQGILDNINAGSVVISDRYALSSLAYQGVTCGSALPWRLNRDFPPPGLTLLFEVKPETAIERIHSRPVKEIYETLEFQKRVHAMYEKMAVRLQRRGWRIERIDAEKDIESVHRDVESHVFAFLGLST